MQEADTLDSLPKCSWIQGTSMLKISQEYLWDRERVTSKEIIHIVVYFRIYSIILKMSTLAHEKYLWYLYKILHWKQINQINNAGLFQNICSHWATILLESVKFNSGLRSKVWLRVSFKVHIVQLTTWRQTISSHSATGSKASVVLLWVPNMTVFSSDPFYLQIWEQRGTARPLLQNDLIWSSGNIIKENTTKTNPSPRTGCGRFPSENPEVVCTDIHNNIKCFSTKQQLRLSNQTTRSIYHNTTNWNSTSMLNIIFTAVYCCLHNTPPTQQATSSTVSVTSLSV